MPAPSRSAVVFSVSGHGFGHASRQIEIINELHAGRPDLRLIVRTPANPWLFDLTLRAPAERCAVECDPGVVQIDSLHLDEAETVRRAARFFADLEAKAASEALALAEYGAALVVADVPPLACRAAALAGIPAIVIGNFTWDWIYEAYDAHLGTAPDLVPSIASAYAHATEAWRLPLSGGFATCRRLRDLPFVARKATRSRDEVRAALDWPSDRRLVLPSFGGYTLGSLRLDRLDLQGWGIVLAANRHTPLTLASQAAPVFPVDEEELYRRGFRYEDLVGAVDAVLTKPGYGIISECVANDTPLVYTSRGHFREYDVLVSGMPRYVRCAFISQEDLAAGRWQVPLDLAVTGAPPPERPATDGARVAAAWISERVR